jgi:hypothetical protein
VFNEIYADPTPSNGLADAEYIELFNTDSIPFELSGWKLVNSTTEKTIPPFNLLPQEHVIICDATFTSLFPNSIGIIALTALTNSGDSLTLIGPNNEIIDVVTYADSWYNHSDKADGGWSLEQINPFKLCSGKSNWSASENSVGGTPGIENSIFNSSPDTEGPQLLNWNLNQSNQVTLIFNENVDPMQTGNFICSNAVISNVSFSEGGSMVIITFDSN